MRTQRTTIPADGCVLILAHFNCILHVTVTGTAQIELRNNNFGHLITRYVDPHVFPPVILVRSPEADASGCFHDLILQGYPGDDITITWTEVFIPYAEQSKEVRGWTWNMFTGIKDKLL